MSSGLEAMGLPTDGAGRLTTYAALLEEVAIPRGFLGPRESERLLERHILEPAGLTRFIRDERPGVVDVGSGAGLPGVVLACLGAGPVVLIESDGRRAAFLEQVITTLDLDCRVVRERAEVAGRLADLRESSGTATGRALAPADVLVELTMPFIEVGGRLVAPVGPSADLGAASRAAGQCGGGPVEVREFEVPGLRGRSRAMIIEKVAVTPARYPRRTGVPAKRPLGGTG